jgi:phage shock protein E
MVLPFILIGGLATAAAYTYFGENLVSSGEAKKMIRSGKIKKVIDVRTAAEYRAGHYRGALHIPVNKINKKTTVGTSKEGATRLLQYWTTGQICGREIDRFGF